MDETRHSYKNLQLPNLQIAGFRGIDYLSISRLGRVTLIAGRNGTGKTTLLEAVQVYAARGRYAVLNGLLRNREEFLEEVDEEGDPIMATDWAALFYGRLFTDDSYIAIGPNDPEQRVQIRVIAPETVQQLGFFGGEHYFVESMPWFKVEFQSKYIEFPAAPSGLHRFMRRRRLEAEYSPAVACNRLGPGLPDNEEVARFWDSVALTDDEDLAVEVLRLIANESVERVAVIGQGNIGPHSRRVMVKIADESIPIPLKSLGDGAARFFGIALGLANSRDGFLVIDEVENGIHHSMQRELWKVVLQTAYENNVQVFAATHSWDCVRGFAQAATELEDMDGVLVRLERRGGRTRAIEYSEKDLQIAAEQGIEVR